MAAAAAIAAAILASAGPVSQIVVGAKQGKESRAIRDTYGEMPPDYVVPESAQEALNVARQKAVQTEMPGEAKLVDRVRESTASGVGQASQYAGSSGELMSLISKLYGQERNQIRDIGIRSSMFQAQQEQRNRDMYLRALGDTARYEDKGQDLYRRFWEQQMASASALLGASRQNIVSGVGAIGNIGSSAVLGMPSGGGSGQQVQSGVSQQQVYQPTSGGQEININTQPSGSDYDYANPYLYQG